MKTNTITRGVSADARSRQYPEYFTVDRPRLPQRARITPCPPPADSRFTDLSGESCDQLLVLQFYGRGTVDGRDYWLCCCECGVHCVVLGKSIRAKRSGSCGCRRFRAITRHGRSHSKEYRVWTDMRARCSNPRNPRYGDYGGRGIRVCGCWQGKSGFSQFFSDMGPAPPGGTLERKDNSRGYSPDNCVWADVLVQARNRRNNRFFEYNGERYCLAEWADKFNLAYGTLAGRIERGWGFSDALMTPVRPRAKLSNKQVMSIISRYEYETAAVLAAAFGVSVGTIYRLVGAGSDLTGRRER